ncbi:MAG: glucuronate isomerase [Clostridiaceae bacterium]|nr:glucuronate isomerase [Clostridiaceae bacterium]
MKKFMDEDFLLTSDSARILYHDFAAKMPVIDYHCHIDPVAIAVDKRYSDITEVWLGGDHYKWRAMRCNGVPESEITGSLESEPYLVFKHWAGTLPRLLGNPLYHWTYLELKKYFGISESLDPASCKSIYERCNQCLQDEDMSVRGIIRQSDVRLICTTDDPIDDLAAHKQIAADPDCDFQVLPAYRPDKAMNIDKPGFAGYINKLAQTASVAISDFDSLVQALYNRIDYFADHGCRASDHALDSMIYTPADKSELNNILAKVMSGQSAATNLESDKFKTAVLLALAEKYHELGWVMQIHFGCLRNNSGRMFDSLGPDTGFDSMNDAGGAEALSALLNAMESRDKLPRMVLYSLNPQDNEVIATIAGAFQTDGEGVSRIQLGSAWWFNDHKTGMQKQLTDLANLGVLANFIGMLTDSRSFLSYTRHEYFRRILCELIGGWVDQGELQPDMEMLGQIVQDICYNNVVKFFGFNL